MSEEKLDDSVFSVRLTEPQAAVAIAANYPILAGALEGRSLTEFFRTKKELDTAFTVASGLQDDLEYKMNVLVERSPLMTKGALFASSTVAVMETISAAVAFGIWLGQQAIAMVPEPETLTPDRLDT